MEIYSLKLKSKTNSNVFIATTDDGEYILHSDIIVSKGIHKGEVDDKIFLDAVADSEVLIGTGVAMKYLGSRLKTEHGIRDYLYNKGYNKSSIDKIVDKLIQYSVIDDRLYASQYIKSNPKFGKLKLKEKLKIAGVSRGIIEELLTDVDDTDSCVMSAEKYLKNKRIDKETVSKLIRHLTGKGYSYDTINSTINKLKREDKW